MAVGGIFQLTGVVNVTGMAQLLTQLTTAEGAARIFSDALESAFKAVIDGAERAFDAFRGFIEDAIREAVKIDAIKQIYAGLYDDEGMAQKKIDFIREYARHSKNLADTLLEVGSIGEMGGLNMTSRIMRDMDVLSRGSAERYRQLTEQLVRASTGSNLARVMQTFSRSGISYNDLRAAGLDVQKTGTGNKINATGEEFVKTILDIAEKKFPKLGEYLSQSVKVKFVDLQDSWSQLLDKFGQTWFPLIGQMLDSVGPFVNFLTDTGIVTAFGESLTRALQVLFDLGGGQSGIESFFAYMIAVFETLPPLIYGIGTTVVTMFSAISNAITTSLNFLSDRFVDFYNTLQDLMAAGRKFAQDPLGMQTQDAKDAQGNPIIDPITGTTKQVPKDWGAKHIPYAHASGLGDLFTGISALMGKFGNSSFDIQKRHDELLKLFDEYKKTPKTPLEDPGGGALFNKIHQEEDTKNLGDIKTNTAKIAAAMEPFKRFALGGGERGQYGVTVSERYGRNPAGGRMQIDVRSGNVHLDRYLGGVIEEYHQSFRREAFGP